MDFNDTDENDTQPVIPDAGIIRQSDGTFTVIKFGLEGNKLTAYTTEISQDELVQLDEVQQIDEYSILFVKINYEFHYDEDTGVMELELSRMVTLSDSNSNMPITAQELIDNSPEDLIPVYLDVIQSI